MAIRRSKPLTWKARGLSDSRDGSTAFPGAMTKLTNLVPDPSTRNVFVPRPASTQVTAFAGFNTPAGGTALFVLGNIAYGMISSAHFAGKDEPFAFDIVNSAFQVIAIPGGAASLPTTQLTTGDWSPPSIDLIAKRIVVTHPGFSGGANPFFGWLDISGFTDATHTGDTHTNTTIDNLSANVLTAGWQVGMTIAGTNIPANTTIKTIAANGLSLVLSQATTGTTPGVTLTVAGGTATAPLWSAGNTNGNPLASVPLWVKQFNGRAYYAVGAGEVFSDSGAATQVTNASQAITHNNGLNVTCLGGIGFLSPISGGIVQSLIAFQADAGMYQIQGDSASTNLTVNSLTAPVGTLAPNSVTETPLGLAFVAPDGLRFIDTSGHVSDPIGEHGDGIAVPFQNVVNPSRMCAAYNENILRISVQNGAAPSQPVQDYWLDFTEKIWTGPHSFPAALISAVNLSTAHGFILFASGIDAKLWQSTTFPVIASSFTENGAALACSWETVLLPDNEEMSMNAVIETALMLQLPTGGQLTIQAIDDSGAVLGTVFLVGSGVAATVWGSFVWGGAPWLGGGGFLQQMALSWPAPLIFKQMQILITGNGVSGLAIGNLYMRYQALKYMLQAS